MGSAPRRIVIEVACAEPGRQSLVGIEVAEGTTIAQAIALSGIGAAHPGLDLSTMRTGIFGKLAPPGTVLRDGDRVEIYRPLRADPKEVRRRRAGAKGTRPGKS